MRSGILAYEAVVEWARDHPDLLMQTVLDARRRTVELGEGPTGEVPLEVEYAPDGRTVGYLLPVGPDGARDLARIESDSLMKRPVVTHSRPRPWAYVIPRDAEEAVELLRRHRVQVEVLTESHAVRADTYTIADIAYESAYNHAAAARVVVEDVRRRDVELPAGTYIVRTGQVQGLVAAHLLEAESRDGVVYWNRMDAWLPKAEVEAFRAGAGEAPDFPILKLMEPTPLAARVLR